MIGKIFLSIAALGVLAPPAMAQQATPKMAYVNLQKVIAQAPGEKQAEAALQKQVSQYKAELQGLQKQIQSMIDDYQKKQATMSAQAKQAQQKAIRQKQQEYQQRVQALQQEASTKQQALMKPIHDEIASVITELRKEKGYAFIFDSSNPTLGPGRVLVAADSALDITDEVMARLAKRASASGSSK